MCRTRLKPCLTRSRAEITGPPTESAADCEPEASYDVLEIGDPWKVKPSVGPKFLFCVCVSICTEPSRRICGGS